MGRDAQLRRGASLRPTARVVAAGALARVLGEGGFAMQSLDGELRRSRLSPRDRALATEIVYGVLRTRVALLTLLEGAARRGLPKGDVPVTCHLLVAAYQLAFLDRVPPHAAVDEAVEAIRALRGAQVGGFANAVLRSVAGKRPSLDEALEQNLPGWLRERLVAAYGRDGMLALLRSSADDGAGVDVRLREGGEDRLPWLTDARPGRFAATSHTLGRRGDPRELEGFDRGAFVVQEEGAHLAGLALGAAVGERVLDACAGHGQKSSLIADRIGPEGELVVTDLHARKLAQLGDEFRRLRLPAPRALALDWTRPDAEAVEALGTFDRVLVDAPCTGTGTLRRRPEILLRLKENDPARFAQSSVAILRNVARVVKPGGRLVYVVCSALPGEGEGVVDAVSDVLEPCAFDAPEVAAIAAGATSFRLTPGEHGTDGYYVACLRLAQ